MKNTVELAAEFIRRAAFVDANALLKDECGVEYRQVPYERGDCTGSIRGWMRVIWIDDVLSMSKRLSAMTWRQRGMTLKPLLSWLGCP